MQSTVTPLPPLAEYLDLKDAQVALGHFPTVDSFRWFIRRHRDQLAACGAMIVVAGRQKFHLKLTGDFIVAAGHRAARGECDS